MAEIVYKSMKVHGKDEGGKYQVYLIGDIDGWGAVFPMLITHDLMFFEGKDDILSNLFKKRAQKLIEQGATRRNES